MCAEFNMAFSRSRVRSVLDLMSKSYKLYKEPWRSLC